LPDPGPLLDPKPYAGRRIGGHRRSESLAASFSQAILWQAKKPVKALAGESYFTIRRLLLSRMPQSGAN
jgi:hypothetical protein